MRFRCFFLMLVVFAAVVPRPSAGAAPPGASPWAMTDHTAVRLIAASRTTGGGATVSAGLHFRLKDGWKIYWRSPGDAGYAPHPDWSTSANLDGIRIAWPAPKRFSVLGLQTLGYEREVVLPLTATLADPQRPLRLGVMVDYLTCKEICVPYTATLSLDLPPGAPQPTRFAHLINRFSARVPGDGAAHGLAIEGARVGGGGSLVHIAATSNAPFVAPDLFVEGPPELVFGKPAVTHVTVAFEIVTNNQVCRVEAAASPAPVFLDEPGGNREADMYVRMGNSTRKLLTDEALEYVGQHWS